MNEYIFRVLIPGKDPVSHYSTSFEPILKTAIEYGGLFCIYKNMIVITDSDNIEEDSALMILNFQNKLITQDHIESIGSETFTGKPGLIRTRLLDQIYDWLKNNLEGKDYESV